MNSAGAMPRHYNGLGLAGFIVSTIGLVLTGGLLCPIGLILSLIAIFIKPRGFAIAGLIVGLIGSVVLLYLSRFIYYTLILQQAFNSPLSSSTLAEIKSRAESQILHYSENNRKLPDQTVANYLLENVNDPWGSQIQYQPITPSQFELISAGPDMMFGTADDEVSSHSANVGGQMKINEGEAYIMADDSGVKRAITTLQSIFSGTMLTDEQGQAGIDGITDDFGTPLQFDATFMHYYILKSAGPDGQWYTEDDPEPYNGALGAD